MTKSGEHNRPVTIIVPAFNAGEWLFECLESIRMQREEGWQAIIADDGSTDNTSLIAKTFADKDSRFSLLKLPHNGVSATRNAAMEFASTNWIMFVDADDVIHPDCLSLLLGIARETKADIAIPRQYYGDIPTVFEAIDKADFALFDKEEILKRLLLRQGVEASMSGVLYRRSLFEEPSRLRFRHCRYEDLDLGYRIIERAGKIALVTNELYFYRRHEGSFIRTLSAERFDVLDVTDRMHSHFLGRPLEKEAASRRFGAHCNILFVMYSHREINPDIEKRCLKVIKELRRATLFGKGIRMKNRLGALLSYGGKRTMKIVAHILPHK